MALECSGEQRQPGVRFAVIGQQSRLRECQVELILRMVRGVVIEQRQRLGARLAIKQQRGSPRARRQRHRRVVEAAVGRDRSLRIAVTRRNIGQIQLRRIVALAARQQLREALAGFLQVPGSERQQREPPIDLRGRRAASAQMLELLVGLLVAIERGENLRKLEAAARSIVRLRLARGGDRLRGIAAHDVGACQHPQRGRILRVTLQRLLRVPCRTLAVVRSQCQFAQQCECIG